MRFMSAVIALSLLPGCSPKGCGARSNPGAPADPAGSTAWDVAQALAQADFDRETARAPIPSLPSGVTTVIHRQDALWIDLQEGDRENGTLELDLDSTDRPGVWSEIGYEAAFYATGVDGG
jgi:hypothetical protein